MDNSRLGSCSWEYNHKIGLLKNHGLCRQNLKLNYSSPVSHWMTTIIFPIFTYDLMENFSLIFWDGVVQIKVSSLLRSYGKFPQSQSKEEEIVIKQWTASTRLNITTVYCTFYEAQRVCSLWLTVWNICSTCLRGFAGI